MISKEKYEKIQRRLKDNAPCITPGEWYHEDVPVLLNALEKADIKIEKALKTCPNSRYDGYIIPRLFQCEYENVERERNFWKSRAEAFETMYIEAIRKFLKEEKYNVCQYCVNFEKEECGDCNSNLETVLKDLEFDQARFVDLQLGEWMRLQEEREKYENDNN